MIIAIKCYSFLAYQYSDGRFFLQSWTGGCLVQLRIMILFETRQSKIFNESEFERLKYNQLTEMVH